MKKVKQRSFFSPLLLSLLVAGCSSGVVDDIIEPENPEPEVNDDVSLIQVYLDPLVHENAKNTRTSIEINDNGAKFLWSDTEVIGIFSQNSDQVKFTLQGESGGNTAVFDGGGWGIKNGYEYAAYYPYASFNSDNGGCSVCLNYGDQSQSGDGSVAHIGSHDFLATPRVSAQDGSLHLRFKHLGCLVRLRLTLHEATGNLRRLCLKASSDCIPTVRYLDLMSENGPNVTSGYPLSDELNVSLSDIRATENGQILTFYLMMPPIDFEDLGVTLNAILFDENNNCYEGRLSSEGRFAEVIANLEKEKMYEMTANLFNNASGVDVTGNASIDGFQNINW